MCSPERLREFVTARLTAAAEDIFVVFQRTIVGYEEEIHRQRRLLDLVLKPQITLDRIDVPDHLKLKEDIVADQQLCYMEKFTSPPEAEPEPLRIKEEPEEPFSISEGEQLALKQENGTSMFEGDHSELQSQNEHKLLLHNSLIATNQDATGIKIENSELMMEPVDQFPSNAHGVDISPIKTFTLPRRPSSSGKPYSCTMCGKTFSRVTHFIIHKRIHTGERMHTCKICGRSCRDSHDLKVHTRIHTGEKPHCCDTCGKRFCQVSHLYSHYLTHKGKPFTCKTCGRSFKQNADLETHILKFHEVVAPDKVSVLTETPKGRFLCTICGHDFSSNQSLKYHMRTHTGERPYCCSVCGKTFCQASVMRKHAEIHTGEKAFTCPTCGKAFRLKGDLKRHLTIHTGERPYSCTICKKAFSRISHLNGHSLVHREEKLFTCETCGRSFEHRMELKNHMSRFHSGYNL